MEQALIVRQRGFVPRIKAALVQWLGVPIELTNHQFWNEFQQGGSNSGEAITVEKALRLSAVWSCVRLIAETVSTLPLVLYRRSPDRQIAIKHPLYFILHDSPNADMTAVTFWEVVLASMLLWGNAYVLIHRAGGVVVSLEFLLPQIVRVKRMPDGSLEYRWRNGPAGQENVVSDEDMLHIPAFTVDGMLGLSPVSYANNVFGNAISAERASGKVFSRGLMMSGTFETPNTVPEKLRTAFKERLEEYRGAINAGSAPLLEAGITYKSIAINPDDAQLLETRSFSIEEICRWYRVPPFMVGHSEKSTSWGTGIEQQMIGFLTFSMRPWLKRVEQAINRKLLTTTERREMYSEFNIEALLRADSTGRSAFYSIMVQNGVYTRNEVREKENLPRMDGADELTAQVNLAPLSMLGKQPVAPAQSPSPPAPAAMHFAISLPEQHPAQVVMHHHTPINVRSPEMRYAAPTINFAPPAIHVPPPPATQVDVHMPDVQVSSPVTVNLPEQPAPRVTINQKAAEAPVVNMPAQVPMSEVEYLFDNNGNVTGARLK